MAPMVVDDQVWADLLRRLSALETAVAALPGLPIDPVEVGTYTPTATGTTTAGTQTYSIQVGRWMRKGREITAHIYLNWSANTGTGTLVISLPFAASSNGVGQRYNVPLWAEGLPYTGDHLQGQIVGGESRFSVSGVSAAGTRTNTPVDAAAIVIATAVYEMA